MTHRTCQKQSGNFSLRFLLSLVPEPGELYHKSSAEYAQDAVGCVCKSSTYLTSTLGIREEDIHQGRVQKLITHPPKNGAYTELFAGLHPSFTKTDNGGWGE